MGVGCPQAREPPTHAAPVAATVGHMEVGYGEPGAYVRRTLIARVGRRRVDADLRHGRLRRIWGGVLIDSSRQLDVRTRAVAALLLCGPSAVICGKSAAWLHGCTAADTSDTHVLVPYEHPARTRPGLAVHNGPMPHDDLVELAGLRVLSVERTVADVLCTAQPREALAVTDQALALQPDEGREGFRARLDQRLAGRADPRGTKRAVWLLGLATGRAESPPESWLLLEVVDLRFPIPEVNWRLCGPDGRLIYRLDLAWPELRIVLEYDGYAVHHGREAEDRARADDLRRRGWIVLTATKEDLRDSRRLEEALRAAFASRGYRRP